MERATLNAERRTETGKGNARALRRGGRIPAVIYKGDKSEALTLNHKQVANFINTTRGEKVLIDLQFEDKTSKLALLKEFQIHPLRGVLMHADLMELSMDVKVRVPVSIHLEGEPIGIRRDKGIMQTMLHEVMVEALPGDLPGHISVDISNLGSGQAIHISDLVAPSGVTVVTDPIEVICSIGEVSASDAAPAEGEAAAGGAPEAKKG
jgi:large subunit ribosomal protein L25